MVDSMAKTKTPAILFHFQNPFWLTEEKVQHSNITNMCLIMARFKTVIVKSNKYTLNHIVVLC